MCKKPKMLGCPPQISFTARSKGALQGDNNRAREGWKERGRWSEQNEKQQPGPQKTGKKELSPCCLLFRTWLINHLYAINHQESTAGLTRSIQMPLKLVERRVRHGHRTWPSVEGTHKNHLSAWPRSVSVSKPLCALWWLYMRPCRDRYNANPTMQSSVVVGGGAILVILYANPQMSTKSLPCFVAASDCNSCCVNKDELNWISHIYHPKSLWKRRKHRCSTWIKGQEAVNKLIDSQSVHVLPKSTPSNISPFLKEVKTTPANTHQ